MKFVAFVAAIAVAAPALAQDAITHGAGPVDPAEKQMSVPAPQPAPEVDLEKQSPVSQPANAAIFGAPPPIQSPPAPARR